MEPATRTFDAAASAIASKATYGGAGMTFFGWLASSEAAALIGLSIGVIGLIVNIIFRWREDRRQQAEEERRHAEHLARMRHIRNGEEHP